MKVANQNECQAGFECVGFWLFCFSTLFMVFFSVKAIHFWPSPWGMVSVVTFCVLPWIFFLPSISWRKIFLINISKLGLLTMLIVLFGILNISFNEEREITRKAMVLFLISGVSVFGMGLVFLNESKRWHIFLTLITFCFAALCIYGLYEGFNYYSVPHVFAGYPIMLFYDNAIPAASILILLSIGPLYILYFSGENWKKKIAVICLFLGVLVILLIGERGSILSVVSMILIWGLFFKKFRILLISVIIISSLSFYFKDQLPGVHKDKLTYWGGLVYRIEAFSLAGAIVHNNPLWGIGLGNNVGDYIPADYEVVIYPSNPDGALGFIEAFKVSNSLDNMLLCFLGETGVLFTLLNIFFWVYVFYKVFLAYRENIFPSAWVKILVMVLAGFFIHSMSFDSLKFPPLNWMLNSIFAISFNLKFAKHVR